VFSLLRKSCKDKILEHMSIKKSKVVPVLNWLSNMPWEIWGSGDDIASPFVTSALDGGQWSASRPCHLTSEERARSIHWVAGMCIWTKPADDRVSISVRVRDFIFAAYRPAWGPPSLISKRYEELLHGDKTTEAWRWPLKSSSAGVRDLWNFASHAYSRCCAWVQENFTWRALYHASSEQNECVLYNLASLRNGVISLYSTLPIIRGGWEMDLPGLSETPDSRQRKYVTKLRTAIYKTTHL
jgi:hypothetical protein